MTKETLASLAAELETCGKTLLKIAEAMKIKEEAPTPEPPKNEVVPKNSPWKRCGRWRRINPGKDLRKRYGI